MAGVKKKVGRSFKDEHRSGKVRSSVEYRSSDLEIDIDVDVIAKSISAGGVAAVVDGLRAITKPTQDKSHPQFKNTGTLVNGIAARPTGTGTADVVAPPDRLQEDVVFERMVELVPVLRDPLGASGSKINAAIDKSVSDAVKARGR